MSSTKNNVDPSSTSSSPARSNTNHNNSTPSPSSNNKNNKTNSQRRQQHQLFVVEDFITLSDTESLNLSPDEFMITPRTNKVLKHLGLKPHHLQEPTVEEVAAEMRRHHEDKLLACDPAAVEMRLKYKLDSQRRLLSQALRAYDLLVQLEPNPADERGGGGTTASRSYSRTGAGRKNFDNANSSYNRSITIASSEGNVTSASNQVEVDARSLSEQNNMSEYQYFSTTHHHNQHHHNHHQENSPGDLQRQMSVVMPNFAPQKRKMKPSASTPQPTSKNNNHVKSINKTPTPGGGLSNSRAPDEYDQDEEDAEALRNAEHIRHANLKRLEQILLKREIVRFKHDKLRDEHEKQLAYERELDAQQRKKDRENAEKQNQTQLERELESQTQREERQRIILEKRNEFDIRTKELDFRWLARRRRVMEENRKRQELNEMRRAAQLETAKQSIEQKRQTAEQGQLISEILLARRRQEQNDLTHVSMEEKAEKSSYRLAEVKARGEALTEARMEKLKERELRQEEIVRQQQKQRQDAIGAKKEKESVKTERRKQAIVIAGHNVQQKKEKVEASVQVYETRAEELKAKKEHEVILRKERMREVELSFELFRERQMCANRARRGELENVVIEKNARAAELAQHRENRRIRRMRIRQEAEKSRVPVENDLPGPGEYEITAVCETGREGPRWSFGIPFSSMGARQISKTTPSPNYEASPGPAVYNPKFAGISRHRKAALFARAERWTESEGERFPTPGPGEYHPSPSKLTQIDEATLEQTLIGNTGYELAADERVLASSPSGIHDD